MSKVILTSKNTYIQKLTQERWLKVGDRIRERFGNSFSLFDRLRIQVSHGTILAYSALFLILFIAFTIRLLPLRWENLSGTILLNEFDPYYQFSITKHMVENGLLSPYWPTQWINTMKWYPDGLNMSGTLPALPMTGAILYIIVSVFGANIDLMTFTAILPAFAAALACLVIYLIGKDIGGRAVGLFSALFLALAPSFLQRSSLGFYDTEVVGVLGLLFFVYFFLRSIDTNRSLRSSILYSLGAGAAMAYFIAGWGAAYYIIGLTALFTFVMVLIKRYNQRLLLSYSITFGLALFIATTIPYLSLNYLVSGAVLPVAAVFVVLIVAELLRNNISMRTKTILAVASLVAVVGGFVALFVTGSFSEIAGKFITVINPFIRSASPLVDSVAEQRISAWGNLYVELGVSIIFFLIGLYFTLRNPTNRNVFLLLFAATSLYFAASMVRILVLFAPVFAIIAAVGILGTLKPFYTLLKEAPRTMAKSKRRMARVSKEYSGVAVFLIFMLLFTSFVFSPQAGGMPRVYSNAYVPTAISSSSLPIGGANLNEPVGAWLDAVHWLNNNVRSTDAVVMWWDYGNWLSDLGNVTSLADNATVNATQIENIGFIYMGNEYESMKMLEAYGRDRVKYIAVFTVLGISQSSGGTTTYIASGAGYGDEGKWYWMSRISGQAKDRLVAQGFMSPATAWTDETAFGAYTETGGWAWSDQGMNSTVYKLMNYAKQRYTDTMVEQGISIAPDVTAEEPMFFKEIYFAGLDTSPFRYGGLVPIIAIYEIDWAAYDAAMGVTG